VRFRAPLIWDISLFSGTYEQALKAISYNMKLGIGGVVTFKMERLINF
jgi:TatD DNase family protein